MMWRGYGFLVPLIAFGCLVLGQLAVDSSFGDGYWQENRWPLVAAGLASGLLLWGLGRRVNRDRVSTWIDPQSGIEFVRRAASHSFFLVPIEWTGAAVALVAVLVAALPD
jgi:hypothetical protein